MAFDMGQLKSEIEAFCAKHSLSGTRFGELAVGDCAFWHKLNRGRDPRYSTVERVRKFMAEYEPEQAA